MYRVGFYNDSKAYSFKFDTLAQVESFMKGFAKRFGGDITTLLKINPTRIGKRTDPLKFAEIKFPQYKVNVNIVESK